MVSKPLIERMMCKCGCGTSNVTQRFLAILTQIEQVRGKELVITSGCRCRKHNAAVGGAEHSLHLIGRAADCATVDADDAEDLCEVAKQLGCCGFGHGQGFVHIDCRISANIIEWRYVNGKPVYS